MKPVDLKDILDRSRIAYLSYLADGRTFRQAKVLFAVNQQARELLRGRRWPPDLIADVDALLKHYDAWTDAWLDSKARLRPADHDVFAFANTVTFPRDCERRIRDFLAL